MVTKTYFHVTLAGKPQRLYINSSTKQRCAVPGGEGLDGPNEFSSEADARKKADAWGLADYAIAPVARDIGTPTRLTEIGF